MMSPRHAFLALVACFALAAAFGQARTELPITTLNGRAGDLLRKWWREGTAAGNVGDFYENRDRGHRRLDTKPYPQLSTISFTPQEVTMRADYSAARRVRTNVVFGNASMASSVENGGSITRSFYSNTGGLMLLHTQYRANNLFAYPEHLDHDPGRDGDGGYGDLLPMNTPYVYTSQGSSGSEMEFMKAMPLTLAAFRPEVKARLIREGLLMPAAQMILRRTGRNVADLADYLAGKAHPSVFEGKNVNADAMVELAHEIELGSIPPLARLQVVEEDFTRAGVDFFEPNATEKLGDTPCAIGRVVRGVKFWRRMVVSADSSFDLNTRPLTWHWSVLRGDTNRVRIKPLNARGSIVEIQVGYHERRPIEPGSAMESSRVDVGCFVQNGAYYSPPAFVCFYFLESEARGYEADGRLVDIGYGAGAMKIEITNWGRIFDLAVAESSAGKFLREGLSGPQFDALRAPSDRYHALRLAQEEAALEEKREADAWYVVNRRFDQARKDSSLAKSELETITREKRAADDQKRRAQEKAKAARDALNEHLAPARAVLMSWIDSCRTNMEFAVINKKALQRLADEAGRPARAELDATRKAIEPYGFFRDGKGVDLKITPARGGAGGLPGQFTPFERMLMERFSCALLESLVFPGMVQARFREHFVPSQFTARKNWRDVYQYNPAGEFTGWTRYGPGQPATEFLADGSLAKRGQRVRYEAKYDRTTRKSTLQWRAE